MDRERLIEAVLAEQIAYLSHAESEIIVDAILKEQERLGPYELGMAYDNPEVAEQILVGPKRDRYYTEKAIESLKEVIDECRASLAQHSRFHESSREAFDRMRELVEKEIRTMGFTPIGVRMLIDDAQKDIVG